MSSFNAKDLLEKQGWTEGSGLGKREHGMKEALKVNIKADTAGVGHDAGATYTFHWWDHVYNSAADSINVVNDEDGVRVSKLGEYELTVKKKQSKLANRNLLYGRFVKSATLHNDGAEVKEAKCSDLSSSDSSDSDTDDKGTVSKITDDELFKKLGGLTAHKAARHGHGLNGKLERLKQQELLSTEKQPKEQEQVAVSDDQECRKKKRKREKGSKRIESPAENTLDLTNGSIVLTDDDAAVQQSGREQDSDYVDLIKGSPNYKSEMNKNDETQKKKKKKKRISIPEGELVSVDVTTLNNIPSQVTIQPINCDTVLTIDCIKKRNKKRKHQKELSPSLEYLPQSETLETNNVPAEICEILDISSDSRKTSDTEKKKRKKPKVDKSFEIEIIDVDSSDDNKQSDSQEHESIANGSSNGIVKKKKKSKKAKL